VVGTVIDDALLVRVARLERTARRDRAFALGAVALLLATAQAPAGGVVAPSTGNPVVVTAASGANARLTAGGLVVRDASGAVRTSAWIDGDGSPSFDEDDASGTLRQTAYLASGFPTLRQFDAKGIQRDELFVSKDPQNPEFTIIDENKVRRLAVFRGSEGNPELALYGSNAAVRAYIATNDNVPYLVMRDSGAHTRVSMGAYNDGTIGMDVRDTAGTTLWKKP
jgi:hypothetical protein